MIRVEADAPAEALEKAVNADISVFNTWFQELKNDPLVPSEIAILKTYLYFKFRVEPVKASGG